MNAVAPPFPDRDFRLQWIPLLLALAFGDGRHIMLVVFSLPSTMIGGVAAVVLTGNSLTLGSMVGVVAPFGMAARWLRK
jgi:multidrug efflux pump subunit AcrB